MSAWDSAVAPRVLARAGELGFSHVVVSLRDFENLKAREIAVLFENHGIRPLVAGNQIAEADVSSDVQGVRKAGRDRLLRMVDFSRDIDADHIGGILYSAPGHAKQRVEEVAFMRTAQILGSVAEYAKGVQVRVVCEVVN